MQNKIDTSKSQETISLSSIYNLYPDNWDVICTEFKKLFPNTQRSNRQIIEYCKTCLRIKKQWTNSEDQSLLQNYKLFGKNWNLLAKITKTSITDVKNHLAYLLRNECEQNGTWLDPGAVPVISPPSSEDENIVIVNYTCSSDYYYYYSSQSTTSSSDDNSSD